jgi:hypothetical protein
VSLEEALELLKQRQGPAVLKELGVHPESGRELQLLDGRYGPYVTDGELNASLGKGEDPDALDLEGAVELLATRASVPGAGGVAVRRRRRVGRSPRRRERRVAEGGMGEPLKGAGSDAASSVTVVGGGLAGCEAALQLARRGHRVRLLEMRPVRETPAHQTDGLGSSSAPTPSRARTRPTPTGR